VGVEGEEECNKRKRMEEEPREAAVNKREGRGNAVNLKSERQAMKEDAMSTR
jgi:hypothetical protein